VSLSGLEKDQAARPAAARPREQGKTVPRIKNGADPQIKAPFKNFTADRSRTTEA
jgi:hypothetical protein